MGHAAQGVSRSSPIISAKINQFSFARFLPIDMWPSPIQLDQGRVFVHDGADMGETTAKGAIS